MKKEKKSVYDVAKEIFGTPLSEAGYEVRPKSDIKKELIDLLNSINIPENIEDKNLLDMFDSFKKLSSNLNLKDIEDESIFEKSRTKDSDWQICPKCSGQGIVSKPTDIAGDINYWSGSQFSNYKCNLCNGKMIISKQTGFPPETSI